MGSKDIIYLFIKIKWYQLINKIKLMIKCIPLLEMWGLFCAGISGVN